MYNENLDELDNKILAILETEARLSYSEIGARVGLSRVAVKNRMDHLESIGIIRGYAAIVNSTNFPYGRRFFMDIITEPNRFDEVVDFFASDDTIVRVYAVTGESRFRAEGYASDNTKYESFMRSVKSHLDGVKNFTIQEALYTIKNVDGGVDYVRKEENPV